MPRLRNQSIEAITRARTLRNSLSESENRLWQAMRNGQLGFRVRRQYPIGPYTLDFFIHDAMLCVEVDGEQHDQRADEDALRDVYLAEQGIETLRIPSMEALTDSAAWAHTIYGICVRKTGRDPLKK